MKIKQAAKPIPQWEIIEKNVIDEIIFRTDKPSQSEVKTVW
jgi:hypothetical protein